MFNRSESQLAQAAQPGIRVGMVSSYPPTRCGIARFASSLVDAVSSSGSSVDLGVVRLISDGEREVARGPIVMEVDPNAAVGIRAAARLLSDYDIAVFQHEFGIYGDDDGSAVVDLVSSVDAPCLVVLHTVVRDPTERQRSIVRQLGRASALVVLCEAAAQILEEIYGISGDSVKVIPHGTSWSAQPVNRPPRRELITWGLLGPGKGIERSLQALSQLRDIDPPIRYRIVGRTHPVVAARSGFSYRAKLMDLAVDLGVSDMVEFMDRYVPDHELFELIRGSDLVVVPYDNEDQVSSGVVTEAVGLGRPVVSTRFPFAAEMLESGAGITVPHDPDHMAAAIQLLLEDPISYDRAAQAAASRSRELSWKRVADRYMQLIRNMTFARATA